MSKKLVARVAKRNSSDDWQKCCRWCHYYDKGKCWNKSCAAQITVPDLNVYSVAENGYSSQAIEEVLNTEKFSNKLMYMLMECFDTWKLSEKRLAEFRKHFNECWGEFADNVLKEELDEAVSIVYQNHLDVDEVGFNGLLIDDPTEFCCKEWC